MGNPLELLRVTVKNRRNYKLFIGKWRKIKKSKLFDGEIDSQPVTFHAKPTNDACGDRGKIREMTKCLALMHIGDMHFNEWDGNASQRVAQCNTGMGQSSRIDDDRVHLRLSGRMDAVNHCAFMVALEAGQADAGSVCLRPGCLFDIGQGSASIDVRLARTQQIQVGSIEQENIFCHLDGIPFDDDGSILPLNDVDWQGKTEVAAFARQACSAKGKMIIVKASQTNM
jgi:hypothetical protein